MAAPHPKRYLCPHYQSQVSPPLSVEEERPRDPGSLVQQLSDSAAVKRLFAQDHTLRNGSSCPVSTPDDATHWNVNHRRQLSEQIRRLEAPPFEPSGLPNPAFVSDPSAVQLLADLIRTITEGIPHSDAAILQSPDFVESCAALEAAEGFVDHIALSWTKSYHPESVTNRTQYLPLLDLLDSRAIQRFYSEICRAVACRTRLNEVAMKAASAMNTHSGMPIINQIADRIWPPEHHDVICNLALEDVPLPVPSNAQCIGNPCVLQRLWLKKVFIQTWDRSPIIHRGTAACGALELLEQIHLRAQGGQPNDESLEMTSVVLHLEDVDTVRTFLTHQGTPTTKTKHILEFHFLFNQRMIRRYFRIANFLRMACVTLFDPCLSLR